MLALATSRNPRSGNETRSFTRRRRIHSLRRKVLLFSLAISLGWGFLIYEYHVLDGLLDASSSMPAFPSLDTSQSESHGKKFVKGGETENENLYAEKDDLDYHVLFSTSCSPFQEWQSTAFFYFANKVKQPGKITRIVSGCSSKGDLNTVLRNFQERIAPLSPNYSLHTTPNYDFTTESNKYMNKPHGVKHWMEKVLGYSSERQSTEHDDAIIMLMDPDMMLLKPMTHKFPNLPPDYWNPDKFTPLYIEVDHGRPIAQEYVFDWFDSIKDHLEDVVLGENRNKTKSLSSPVFDLKGDERRQRKYTAGPPYLATARDFYRIVSKWVDVAPRVQNVYQHMMAEMHSYAVAAAHEGLPHQLTRNFMVSNADIASEGWGFLNDLKRKDACQPPPDTMRTDKLPFVFHYCQRYGLGRWFFSKYKLPTDMFSDCKAPLLRLPPPDIGEELDWYTFANGEDHMDFLKHKNDGDMRIKMNAFAVCTLLGGINDVARYMRDTYCRADGESANYDESFVFIESEEFDAFIRNPTKAAKAARDEG